MVHSNTLGFITPGKALSPPLGSSTYGVNALPHHAGASAQLDQSWGHR